MSGVPHPPSFNPARFAQPPRAVEPHTPSFCGFPLLPPVPLHNPRGHAAGSIDRGHGGLVPGKSEPVSMHDFDSSAGPKIGLRLNLDQSRSESLVKTPDSCRLVQQREN